MQREGVCACMIVFKCGVFLFVFTLDKARSDFATRRRSAKTLLEAEGKNESVHFADL